MIDIYLEKLRMKRLSPKTLELYRIELQTLERLGRDKQAIENHLMDCEASTHVRKLGLWKRYLESIGDNYLAEFQRPRIHRKVISYLNPDEIKTLEAYAETLGKEERLFIKIGLYLGLRISEILQINKWKIESGWVKVKRKGGNEQAMPLVGTLEEDLKNFQGFRKSKRYFQVLLPKIGRACGFKNKLKAHTLRHTFATRAVHAGHDIVTIRDALGHASINTTERYFHSTPQRMHKMMEGLIK